MCDTFLPNSDIGVVNSKGGRALSGSRLPAWTVSRPQWCLGGVSVVSRLDGVSMVFHLSLDFVFSGGVLGVFLTKLAHLSIPNWCERKHDTLLLGLI